MRRSLALRRFLSVSAGPVRAGVRLPALVLTGVVAGSALLWGRHTVLSSEETAAEESGNSAGERVEGLPEYSLEDVSKHCNLEDGVWVVWGEAVYDITEFVQNHPGGDKIMLAAGGDVAPFWSMYQQHKQSYVMEILESLRIGNLAPEDVGEKEVDVDDPYSMDPERHPSLVIVSAKPFNAETPAAVVADNWITPNALFYKRNHLPVPVVEEEEYRLRIVRQDGTAVELTLEDLRTKYEQHKVTATIQCAGNRREEMSSLKPVRGSSWKQGAISNAEWSGVLLRDVLRDVAGADGPSAEVRHVHFVGLDKDDERQYGASIPAEIAFAEHNEVLLALEMNGETLPRDHGYPVRAVVPGVVGARNVKWVGEIALSKDESPSHWQQRDYRSFAPNVDWDNVDWDSAPSIQYTPVTSAVTEASVNEEEGVVQLRGYAWSGGGRAVVRVDVTPDEGESWHQAQLLERPEAPWGKNWTWTLWSASIPIKRAEDGKVHVAVRAVDDQYNVQPEQVRNIWNLRGVLNNAWHRVEVQERT